MDKKTLSDAIIEQSPRAEYHKVLCNFIPAKDVKEFVKLLKEDFDNPLNDDLSCEEIINKRAGDDLI